MLLQMLRQHLQYEIANCTCTLICSKQVKGRKHCVCLASTGDADEELLFLSGASNTDIVRWVNAFVCKSSSCSLLDSDDSEIVKGASSDVDQAFTTSLTKTTKYAEVMKLVSALNQDEDREEPPASQSSADSVLGNESTSKNKKALLQRYNSTPIQFHRKTNSPKLPMKKSFLRSRPRSGSASRPGSSTGRSRSRPQSRDGSAASVAEQVTVNPLILMDDSQRHAVEEMLHTGRQVTSE